MNKITAIIPVLAGCTRLKNKNIAPFAGTNLLVNKINQLKQVQEIDWQKFEVHKRTERRAA